MIAIQNLNTKELMYVSDRNTQAGGAFDGILVFLNEMDAEAAFLECGGLDLKEWKFVRLDLLVDKDKVYKWKEIKAAMKHYKKVQKEFGDDDLSEEYREAIGDVPNFNVFGGKVFQYLKGGRMLEVLMEDPENIDES